MSQCIDRTFLKLNYEQTKYTIATFVKQKMATSDENAAHRSAIQVCIPSGFKPINTFCGLKSTECYKNVPRALAYIWHGRISDGSTIYTSCGCRKYQNYRTVKSTPDAIDCD